MDKILVYLSIIHNGNWDKIYNDILNKVPINKEDIESIVSKNKSNYISILNPIYPTELKHIFKPPFILFYKGDISFLSQERKKIAIIGSRNNSCYGKLMTEKICSNIVKNSTCVIVSGLAKGIDSIAHKTCIENNGKTIAVLGNGLNISYPKENESLYKLIEKEGLILSEYPDDVAPDKNNFPARNRIIAGLCDAIVVTEAKIKSGTMNTVSHALEDSKTIFCVPDKADCESGCNKLIKEGAKLIEDGFDVLEELL